MTGVPLYPGWARRADSPPESSWIRPPPTAPRSKHAVHAPLTSRGGTPGYPKIATSPPPASPSRESSSRAAPAPTGTRSPPTIVRPATSRPADPPPGGGSQASMRQFRSGPPSASPSSTNSTWIRARSDGLVRSSFVRPNATLTTWAHVTSWFGPTMKPTPAGTSDALLRTLTTKPSRRTARVVSCGSRRGGRRN